MMKSFRIDERVEFRLNWSEQRKLLSEKKRRVRHIIAKPEDNSTDEGGGAVPNCDIFRNAHSRSR